MNFVEALKVSQGVLETYKQNYPKFWLKLDGTPILNDLSVRMAEAFVAQAQQPAAAVSARPLAEYHEDFGVVTWWRFPVEEPAWIGTPNDDDWPGYYTHWTPHPEVPAMLAAKRGGGA